MSEDVPILEVDGSGDRGQKGEEGTRLIAGGTASSSAVLEQEAGSASDTKGVQSSPPSHLGLWLWVCT